MIQEDKQLLFVDLCARLPYGLKVHYKTAGWEDKNYTLSPQVIDNFLIRRDVVVKPYLRPMSSMTGEEMEEMHNVLSPSGTAQYGWDGIKTPVSHFGDFLPYEYFSRVIDWLNANRFDFRGLIPRGCAIAVTEDNNPYKD